MNLIQGFSSSLSCLPGIEYAARFFFRGGRGEKGKEIYWLELCFISLQLTPLAFYTHRDFQKTPKNRVKLRFNAGPQKYKNSLQAVLLIVIVGCGLLVNRLSSLEGGLSFFCCCCCCCKVTREGKHTHTHERMGPLGTGLRELLVAFVVWVSVCPFYFRVALGLKPVQSSRQFFFYFISFYFLAFRWLNSFVVWVKGGAAGR